MEVSEEIFKRLDGLAQTLGTTSQYLYQTLAKKGFALGIFAILNAIAFVLWAIVTYRLFDKIEWSDNSYDICKTKKDCSRLAVTVFSAILLLIVAAGAFSNSTDIIYLFTPESYATERTIQILK